MFTINPFANLPSAWPAGAMQTYVVLMVLAVIAGTLLDIVHKGSAKYFFANWRPMRHRAPVVDVDFSPDGHHLVTASRDGSARVWLAATGQPLAEPIAPGPAVLDASFGAKGQLLALGCDDGHVAVWDTLASQPLLTSLRHPAVVTVCQFSPAGPRLATGSGDHQARIWDLVTATGAAPGWVSDVVKAVAGGEDESMEGAARESHESFQAFRSRMLSLPATDDWGR